MNELALLTTLLRVRGRAMLIGDAEALRVMDPMILHVAWQHEDYRALDVRAVWERMLDMVQHGTEELQEPVRFVDTLRGPGPSQTITDMEVAASAETRGIELRADRTSEPVPHKPDSEISLLVTQFDQFDCPASSRYPVLLAAGAISSAWPSLEAILQEGQPRGATEPDADEETYFEQARQVLAAPVRRVAETGFGGQTIFAGYSIFGSLQLEPRARRQREIEISHRDDGLIEARLWRERTQTAARMLVDERLGCFRGNVLQLSEAESVTVTAEFVDGVLGVSSMQIGLVEA